MTRVFLADAQPDERSALRLTLQDLRMAVVGECDDWAKVLMEAPTAGADILLVDDSLLPAGSASGVADLRQSCPKAVIIVLVSNLDARGRALPPAGADDFISKSDPPERVAERLRRAAGRTRD